MIDDDHELCGVRVDRRAEFLADWVRMVPVNPDHAALRRRAIRNLRASLKANPPV